MKKKCVPQNNAIKIKTPVECPTPIIPIVEGCIDPFTYVWTQAVNQTLLDDSSIAENLDMILDKGLVVSNATNVCCPDCLTNPIYSLANIETFQKLGEALYWLSDDTNLPCCISVQASIESYLKYIEFWQVEQPECCKTDFESCLNKFSTIVDLDTLLDKGVVEVDGFGGNTLLCKIYDLFINTSEDLFNGSTYGEVLDRFLDKGFVAYCCDCNVVIGSVEAFLKWWEATDGCGTATPPAPTPK